jgi:hypothetical protein
MGINYDIRKAFTFYVLGLSSFWFTGFEQFDYVDFI